MITKRKLREEISGLKNRVADLEERLCPCESHDWRKIDEYYVIGCSAVEVDTVCTYKCRRCGKNKKTVL